MKKSLWLLAFTALFTVIYAAGDSGVSKDSSVSKPRVEIRPVKKPVIDGNRHEDIKTPPVEINSGSDELSARVYLGHTPAGLYVFAEIKDDTVIENNFRDENIWNGDGIEILMSSNSREDPARKKMAATDNRIGIPASPSPAARDYHYSSPAAGVQSFYKKNGSGYSIEALLPWRVFRKGCSCRLYNNPVAFNIAVNDADSSIGKDFHIRWCGDYTYSINPSQWGEAVLLTK